MRPSGGSGQFEFKLTTTEYLQPLSQSLGLIAQYLPRGAMTDTLRFDEAIRFDTERFPFDTHVLAAIRGAVPGLSGLRHLSQLHEFITDADRRPVEDAVYRLFATAEFQDLYGQLCAEIIRTR